MAEALPHISVQYNKNNNNNLSPLFAHIKTYEIPNSALGKNNTY